MAAIARSTPTFALPATQNTAPVHEFRCLYTHDIRKKAKKWHDGSARFHTFNKRVMVYDDTKNYIGDLHYRADEDFGEGVELQLDRGVLVEVGEQVGETQTDVTGIRNVPHAISGLTSTTSSAVQPRLIQRTNYLTSQGRPKSLVELLGTPQGRHGRANLPLTSPFEQRQIGRDIQTEQTPAKRQKTSLGKENTHAIPQQRKQPTYSPRSNFASSNLASSPAVPQTASVRHASPQLATRRPSIASNIIDISSEEDVQQKPKPATKKVAKPSKKNTTKEKETESAVSSSSKRYRNELEKRSKANTVIPLSPNLPSPRALIKTASAPVARVSSVSNSPASSLRPGMSQLKMQTQKPRRKLMYKTLLPSSVADQSVSRPSSATREQRAASREREEQAPPPDSDAQANNDDQDFALDDFEQLLSYAEKSPSPSSVHHTPPRPIETPRIVQPSPLFVSQTLSQRSPSPLKTFAEDHFDIPATQRIQTARTPRKQDNIDGDVMQVDITDGIDEPESPCFPRPRPLKSAAQISLTSMAPPKLSTTLTAKSSTTRHRSPSPERIRPTARSLSEDNESCLANLITSPPRQSINLPEELAITTTSFRPGIQPPAPLLSPFHTSNKSPEKPPVQPSSSSANAILPTTIGPEPTSPVSGSNEEGPWTKLEAFLLFDKWPTCKQKEKPVFDVLDHDDTADDVDVPMPPPARMRIRTARSLMRDG